MPVTTIVVTSELGSSPAFAVVGAFSASFCAFSCATAIADATAMAIAEVPINKRPNLDFDFTRTPSCACTQLIF
jgi:hypothetical protein